jgi:hypothetical protein
MGTGSPERDKSAAAELTASLSERPLDTLLGPALQVRIDIDPSHDVLRLQYSLSADFPVSFLVSGSRSSADDDRSGEEE